MNIFYGYGAIILFFVATIGVIEYAKHKGNASFSEYAVGGRSFGSWFQAMAFVNSWLPGTIFVAFAGLAAGQGIIGFYVLQYSLLTVLLMFMMGGRTYNWAVKHDLHTQADFLGMRYGSDKLRLFAAILGVICLLPWLVLALQSVSLIFRYLGFDQVSSLSAVVIGTVAVTIRQIWTAKLGTRGLMISDMIQGSLAYIGGALLALGFIMWLVANGHGWSRIPMEFSALPGWTSDVGPLYYAAIIITSGLGSMCWPSMFIRLFSGDSARTVKRSAGHAGLIMIVFLVLLLTMSILAHDLGAVSEIPDNVWFLTAKTIGPWALILAGIAVLGAAVGTVNEITLAIGTHTSQDIIHHSGNASESRLTRTAKLAVLSCSLIGAVGALITVDWASGMFLFAIVSYQGIVQLAPSLYIGLFWKRGTAPAAIIGLVVGTVIAGTLQVMYPISIPGLYGATAGLVGLIVNAALYVMISIMTPQSTEERVRIDKLFAIT